MTARPSNQHIHYIREESTCHAVGALLSLSTGRHIHSLSKEPHNTRNTQHTVWKTTCNSTTVLIPRGTAECKMPPFTHTITSLMTAIGKESCFEIRPLGMLSTCQRAQLVRRRSTLHHVNEANHTNAPCSMREVCSERAGVVSNSEMKKVSPPLRNSPCRVDVPICEG